MLTLFVLFILVCMCIVFANGNENKQKKHLRRQLSAATDLLTNENTKTYNGIVPRVSCEVGFYRPLGGSNLQMITGQRQDGCISCPRGTFGSSTGLTDRTCTGSCPVGKFSGMVGRTSANDCEPCPLGRYGIGIGLTSQLCTSSCPTGKYTLSTGQKDATSCIQCNPGDETYPCDYPVKSRYDRRTRLLNS